MWYDSDHGGWCGEIEGYGGRVHGIEMGSTETERR